MKNSVFYACASGFLAGVAVESYIAFKIEITIILFSVGVCLFFLHFLILRKKMLIFSLFLCCLALGMYRFALHDEHSFKNSFESEVGGKKITVEGIIIEEPRQKEFNQEIILDVKRENASAKLLVGTDFYQKFSYGDRVMTEGVISTPKNFVADNGKEVDYRAYLAREEIFYEMKRARVEIIEHGKGNILKHSLLLFKQQLLTHMRRMLPEPHASLLAGITLGVRDALGAELKEKLQRTGVIHIVVLSGYNITLVAEYTMKAIAFLGTKLQVAGGIFAIVSIVIMAGGGASVARAGLMALLALFAKVIGRRYSITRALCIAGCGMVLHNPRVLMFDYSFALSFLATIGLIFIAPLIEKYLHHIPERFGFRQIASATLGTQLAVLPLILYQSGSFSLVALPVNLFVLIAIPLTMFAGFVGALLSYIHAYLAFPFSLMSYGLLSYELGVVEWFSRLPFASVSIPVFPFWIVVVVYVFYFFIISKNKFQIFSP